MVKQVSLIWTTDVPMAFPSTYPYSCSVPATGRSFRWHRWAPQCGPPGIFCRCSTSHIPSRTRKWHCYILTQPTCFCVQVRWGVGCTIPFVWSAVTRSRYAPSQIAQSCSAGSINGKAQSCACTVAFRAVLGVPCHSSIPSTIPWDFSALIVAFWAVIQPRSVSSRGIT